MADVALVTRTGQTFVGELAEAPGLSRVFIHVTDNFEYADGSYSVPLDNIAYIYIPSEEEDSDVVYG